VGLELKNDKLVTVRLIAMFILLLPLAAAGQDSRAHADEALVKRALANEVRLARDAQHPMRFRLRKSSPALTSTKEIYETKDGAIAHLIAINDSPLSASDEQKEQARLADLLSDPSEQRRRKQEEEKDAARAMKLVRLLPDAFLYHYTGTGKAAGGEVEKFAFTPNPKFDPPDLETDAMTKMTGEIWIDIAQERVARLEGHLQEDVDFAWGILGRLNKGGWVVLEQEDVGDHQWRIVHFKMAVSGRVVFKTKVFDTNIDESQFAPLPVGLSYQKAIQMMQTETAEQSH